MRITLEKNQYSGYLLSYETGKHLLNNLKISDKNLNCDFQIDGTTYVLNGLFSENKFSGQLTYESKTALMSAEKVNEPKEPYAPPVVDYILTEAEINPIESDINHQELVHNFDFDGFIRGERIYNSKG